MRNNVEGADEYRGERVPRLESSSRLGDLVTEAYRPDLDDLDLLEAGDLVRLMNREDALVPAAVGQASEAITAAIEGIVKRMRPGGRLVYVGAGTSGRLGALDAAECPPTFNTPAERVVAVVAGGDAALSGAEEAAEDDDVAGATAMDELEVGASDAVVGIAASGRTPFVIGAVRRAAEGSALTVGLSCNPDAELSRFVDHPIEVVVGPEFVSGSTRLKAGSAQKMVLNMISTVTMIRLGKTYGNLMVDLKATNQKLNRRAVRIVAQASRRPEEEAEEALSRSEGDAKVAVVMLVAAIGADDAARLLEKHGGMLRNALEARA
jgi:N-acetylmuramic acid 6-phosphate etherase